MRAVFFGSAWALLLTIHMLVEFSLSLLPSIVASLIDRYGIPHDRLTAILEGLPSQAKIRNHDLQRAVRQAVLSATFLTCQECLPEDLRRHGRLSDPLNRDLGEYDYPGILPTLYRRWRARINVKRDQPEQQDLRWLWALQSLTAKELRKLRDEAQLPPLVGSRQSGGRSHLGSGGRSAR